MKRYAVTNLKPPFGRPDTDDKERLRWNFQATQRSKVYDALYRAGKDGLSRHEVAAKIGLAADRISFYLSELRRSGLIFVKGDPSVVHENMNAQEALEAALLNLEKALVVKLREKKAKGIAPSPEQERAFVKYSKCKELALRPGTSAEGDVAMRMTLTELLKLVF